MKNLIVKARPVGLLLSMLAVAVVFSLLSLSVVHAADATITAAISPGWLSWVTFYLPKVLSVVGTIIAIAAPVAAITPTPADDGIVGAARKVLDVLAFNVGHAKNAQ